MKIIKMEVTNTSNLIENPEKTSCPASTLQELGVIKPMISNQANKEQIVSNFTMWSRGANAVHYTTQSGKRNLDALPYALPTP